MCGTRGALVNSKTVKSLANIIDENCQYTMEVFSLCMDPSCEMAYFSADYGYLLLQRDIGVDLDYKDDVDNRYACYCKKITIGQVRRAVLKDHVKTVKEFFKYQSPVIVEECKSQNPFGCCCIPDIKKMIEDIIIDNR